MKLLRTSEPLWHIGRKIEVGPDRYPTKLRNATEVFLDEMNQVVPRAELVALIAPFARGAQLDKAEKIKASVRAKVEHPFRVIKQQFGYAKLRYQVLQKNTDRLMMLFALGNLWMARRRIMALQA